ERTRRTRAPEILASGLYQLFTGGDAGTTAFRRAVYSLWRSGPRDRVRTMRLLSGDDTSVPRLRNGFFRLFPSALAGLAGEIARTRRWSRVRECVGGLRRWLQFPSEIRST